VANNNGVWEVRRPSSPAKRDPPSPEPIVTFSPGSARAPSGGQDAQLRPCSDDLLSLRQLDPALKDWAWR
jgi:hypothetical protein